MNVFRNGTATGTAQYTLPEYFIFITLTCVKRNKKVPAEIHPPAPPLLRLQFPKGYALQKTIGAGVAFVA
jgi:hypothetical protein